MSRLQRQDSGPLPILFPHPQLSQVQKIRWQLCNRVVVAMERTSELGNSEPLMSTATLASNLPLGEPRVFLICKMGVMFFFILISESSCGFQKKNQVPTWALLTPFLTLQMRNLRPTEGKSPAQDYPASQELSWGWNLALWRDVFSLEQAEETDVINHNVLCNCRLRPLILMMSRPQFTCFFF